MSGASFAARAVVLRAIDYRESDRILTLYTEEDGRLSALARGARASKRRFRGSLEPFCILALELQRSRGDLLTLTSARVERAFPRILAQLACMREAGEGTALVRDLSVDAAPEPRLFAALETFYEHLGQSGTDAHSLSLAFQARALAVAGLAPSIDVCMVSGVRRAAGQAAYFDPGRGGIVRRQHLGGSQVAIPLSGAALDAFQDAMGPEWHTCAAWPAPVQAALDRALTAFRRTVL